MATIDPALNAAILTAINALEAAALIPSPTSTEALVGGVMMANSTCLNAGADACRAELELIIRPTPQVFGKYTRPGYTQAALTGLS
jgi:hypothetical protein